MGWTVNQSARAFPARACHGNAITEYGLIGLLVVGVCTIAITTLGSSLSKTFANLIQGRPHAASTMSVASTSTTQSASLPLTGGSLVRLTLSNGTEIQIPNYPVNLAGSVNTIGANGTTTMLADSLKTLASQMLAANAITEDEYNRLIALSNQAHYIASIEKTLETAAANADSSREFSSTPIRFDGKTYSARELRYLIGYGNGSLDPNNVTDHMSDPTAYPAVQTFQTLYQRALQGGALNDPAAVKMVQTLSEQVAYLSDVATIATSKIISADIPPSDMNQSLTADVSHMKSAGICSVGNGTDSGIQCAN